MNQLEGLARPLLTPLITGAPVTLNREQQTTIAKWVVLKSLVLEHSASDTILTPRDEKIAFRNSGKIPGYFHVYIANHNARHSSAMVRRTRCMAIGSPKLDPPLVGTTKNVETITFYLGQVFVHVVAARVTDFELERVVQIPTLYETSRIWPLDHDEMIWPHNPVFTAMQIDSIADSIDAFVEHQGFKWAGDLE